MRRLLALVALSAGAWVGWIAGSAVSLLVAFLLSVVGAAAGHYAWNRFVSRYLP